MTKAIVGLLQNFSWFNYELDSLIKIRRNQVIVFAFVKVPTKYYLKEGMKLNLFKSRETILWVLLPQIKELITFLNDSATRSKKEIFSKCPLVTEYYLTESVKKGLLHKETIFDADTMKQVNGYCIGCPGLVITLSDDVNLDGKYFLN